MVELKKCNPPTLAAQAHRATMYAMEPQQLSLSVSSIGDTTQSCTVDANVYVCSVPMSGARHQRE